jgi:hypothetical protein
MIGETIMKLSTDFAFAGFGLVRNKPLAVLVWALLYGLYTLAMIGIIVQMGGTAFKELNDMSSSSASTDPSEILSIFGRLALPFSLIVPLSIVFGTALYTALYRAILQPEKSSFAYLRFGMDEIRVILVSIANAFIIMGMYILVIIPVFIVSALAGWLTKTIGVEWIGGLLIFLIIVGIIAFLITFVLRLSLNLPQAFDIGKIKIFGGFELSRGNIGNYILGMVIAFVLAIVVIVLSYIVYTVCMIMIKGGDLESALASFASYPGSVAEILTPEYFIYLIFSGLIGIIGQTIVQAPMVAAYKSLSAAKKKTDWLA